MLTAAVLSAICAFGGYSENLSNYPRYYDNLITIHCYYDLNKVQYQNGYYEVLHFHDICKVNADFEKQDDGIHVFINDMDIKTYLINNATNNNETLIGSSLASNFSNGLGANGVLLLPNDDYRYLRLTHENWSATTSNASYRTYFTWYDDTIDDGASTYANSSFSISNVVGGTRANSYEVSLTDLYNVVNSRFASTDGGYYQGYTDGYRDGEDNGLSTGYNTGYSDGYTNGVNTDQTAFTIFNGILTIGMIPINVFLAMFDFSILGINISNFVMSLLTVLVTIWVIRIITGGGKGETD